MTLAQRVKQATDFIAPQIGASPEIALILGSGLGGLADLIEVEAAIDYADIPNFKASTAPGHSGRLLFGTLAGRFVVCMQGRLHNYEGHAPEDIVFPLRVMHALGAHSLVVTNAAGGLNPGFTPGDIMLITDHINFTALSPLTIGEEQGLHDFTDMSFAYTPTLRELALSSAEKIGLNLQQGVYLGLRGPCFETPAEIRAFRIWGVDATGMSTVFEVIAASALKMRVLGLSLISNMAAGIHEGALDGAHVIEVANKAGANMQALLLEVLPGI